MQIQCLRDSSLSRLIGFGLAVGRYVSAGILSVSPKNAAQGLSQRFVTAYKQAPSMVYPSIGGNASSAKCKPSGTNALELSEPEDVLHAMPRGSSPRQLAELLHKPTPPDSPSNFLGSGDTMSPNSAATATDCSYHQRPFFLPREPFTCTLFPLATGATLSTRGTEVHMLGHMRSYSSCRPFRQCRSQIPQAM